MFQEDISENAKTIIGKIIEKEKITEAKIFISDASDKGTNFMGVLHRITITGVKYGENITKKIICKSIPPIEAVRETFPIVKYFHREVHAYNECMPALDTVQNEYRIDKKDKFNFVKCYRADAEKYNEIIFLEDLCDQGFKVFDRKTMLDMEHITVVIGDIARLHALSFALKKNDLNSFQVLVDDIRKDYVVNEPVKKFVTSMKDQVLEVIADPVRYEKFYKYTENLYDKFFVDMNSDRTEPYNVICHGDCWVNNFLFKYENNKPVELRLVDWQMMRYSTPVVDIIHMIFICMDEEFRSQHYDEIFNMYYEELRKQLKKFNCEIEKCYPEKIFNEQQSMMLPYALTVAVMSIPLLLCENDEVIDMENLAERGTYDKNDYLKNPNSKNSLKERMEGIIRDLSKLSFFESN